MKNVYLASTLLVASLTCSLSLADAKGNANLPSHNCDNNGRCWSYVQLETPRYRTRAYKRAQKSSRHTKTVPRRASRTGVLATRTQPWNMVKVKTVQGFYLTVHPAYAHKFLRLFEILEQNGIKVPREIVGCFSRGGHVRGSNHYIGAACDIQTGWNRTIPALYHAGKWIREAGLYDGCSFGDCGHIEAVRGTHNKAPNLYASVQRFKIEEATLNYQP